MSLNSLVKDPDTSEKIDNNNIGKNHSLEKYNKIHPLILLHYIKNIKIVEDPLFYSSKNTIAEKDGELCLILREPAFSGLSGQLTINETASILFEENGRELLEFLSIFSGKLYELRSKYFLYLLPLGYAEQVRNSLIGYHYPKMFRSKGLLNKNKSLFSFRKLLERTFLSTTLGIKIFVLESHKMVKCKVNKQNLCLGNILLGEKLLVKNLEIHCYFRSLQQLQDKREMLDNLALLAPIYSTFFTIKTYIDNNINGINNTNDMRGVILGKYILGFMEVRSSNKRFYSLYDENSLL